jgi:flagellar basal body-associated protein FliL
MDIDLSVKNQALKTVLQDSKPNVEEVLMQVALHGDRVNHVFFKID